MKNKNTNQLVRPDFEGIAETYDPTRRQFLWRAGAALAWGAVVVRSGNAEPGTLASPLGYSIISWPEDAFQQAFETISALGYKGVQILPWVQDAYSGSKTAGLKTRLQKLNLVPVALSCRGVSLSPEHPDTSIDKFREDVEFFRSVDGRILQVTDSGKPRGSYSPDQIKSLGERMNELGEMAKDAGMTLGYHPHFGTFGETRDAVGKIMNATDPRFVGLIVDVAHLKLGGADPAEVIRTYDRRLVMLHLKDLRRDTYELAQKDLEASRKMRLRFCEIGKGVVDFPAIVESLRKIQYKGWGIVELDRYAPAPGGPAESAKINRDALRALGFNI